MSLLSCNNSADQSAHIFTSLPVIDISPFLQKSLFSDTQRQRVIEEIGKASEEWGFFQIVNHGMSQELIDRALQVSKTFFVLPVEEKIKVRPDPKVSPVPTGFQNKDLTRGVLDRKEHLLFYVEGSDNTVHISNPYSNYNVWPQKPEKFRCVAEEFIENAEKIATLVMEIVSASLGLAPNFLNEVYKEKTNSISFFYYPTAASTDTSEDEVGLSEHKDANVLTILAQNEVAGLQVNKDGEWFHVTPIQGALVVNIGDVIQVWTNGKYKSATHRIMNNKNGARYSLVFFCTPGIGTHVTPIQEFTALVNQRPRYRSFLWKEYLDLRFQNKTLASADANLVDVEIYSIA